MALSLITFLIITFFNDKTSLKIARDGNQMTQGETPRNKETTTICLSIQASYDITRGSQSFRLLHVQHQIDVRGDEGESESLWLKIRVGYFL